MFCACGCVCFCISNYSFESAPPGSSYDWKPNESLLSLIAKYLIICTQINAANNIVMVSVLQYLWVHLRCFWWHGDRKTETHKCTCKHVYIYTLLWPVIPLWSHLLLCPATLLHIDTWFCLKWPFKISTTHKLAASLHLWILQHLPAGENPTLIKTRSLIQSTWGKNAFFSLHCHHLCIWGCVHLAWRAAQQLEMVP